MLDGLGNDAIRALAARLIALQRRLGDERDATNQRAWLLGEVAAFAGDAEALVTLGAIAEALHRRARRAARKTARARRRVAPKRLAAMLDDLASAPAPRRRRAA